MMGKVEIGTRNKRRCQFMARVCFRKRNLGVQGKSGMQKCGLPEWRGVSANKSLAKAGDASQRQACARPWVPS